MNISRSIFSIFLLLILFQGSLIVYGGEAVSVDDEYIGYIDWRDLRNISVYDDGNNLVIEALFWDYMPLCGSYFTGFRALMVGLDLDNNRYTGYLPGVLNQYSSGAEITLYATINSNMVTGLVINKYASDGTYIGTFNHPEWVEPITNLGFKISIPLNWLNITNGDTIAILSPRTSVYFADQIYVTNVNFTIPYANNIVLNGIDNDWRYIDPAIVDYDEPCGAEGECDLIEQFFASNNESLFIAFRRGNHIDENSLDKYNSWDWGLITHLDTDLDGSTDYSIIFRSKYVAVFNYGNYQTIYYYPGSPELNMSDPYDDFVEYSISPSIIGLSSDLAGRNITIYTTYMSISTVDPLGTNEGMSYGMSRVFYTIGVGGYITYPIDYFYKYIYHWGSVNAGNADINLYATSSTYVYLWAVVNEPTGNASLPLGYSLDGYYYVLEIAYPDRIQWPITINVNVSSNSTLFYYNKSTGTYEAINDQIYDPVNNFIRANISMEEYLAGDEPVFVAAENPVLKTSPSTGHVGSIIHVYGKGFEPLSLVTVYLDTNTYVLATTYSNEDGEIDLYLQLPLANMDPGIHMIMAEDSYGLLLKKGFNVTDPMIQVSPSSGAIGQEISITVSGLSPSQTYYVLFDDSVVMTTLLMADQDGNIDTGIWSIDGTSTVSLRIPATNEGVHKISVVYYPLDIAGTNGNYSLPIEISSTTITVSQGLATTSLLDELRSSINNVNSTLFNLMIGLESNLTDLADALDILEGIVDDLSNNVDYLSSIVDQLESMAVENITSLQSEIDAISLQLSDLISGTEQAIGDVMELIDELDSRITSMNESYSNITSGQLAKIMQLRSDLEQLLDTIITLSSRIDTLSSNLEDTSSTIATQLQEGIQELKEDLVSSKQLLSILAIIGLIASIIAIIVALFLLKRRH